MKALRTATALLLAIMFLAVVLEVIARYVLASPPFWTEEFARYCMFYLVLLGSTVALRVERHPSLLFVVQSFPPILRKVWSIVLDGVIAVVLVFVFWEGLKLVIGETIMKTPAMRLSFSWVYAAFPLGALLMLLETVARYLFGSASFTRQDKGLLEED